MKLILTGEYEATALSDAWQGKCAVEFIPLSRLIGLLKDSQSNGLMADVIVAPASAEMEFFGSPPLATGSPLDAIIKSVGDLRKLDSMFAMSDGRKWNAIPFVALLPSELLDVPIPPAFELSVIFERAGPADTLQQIEQIFRQYRDRLLDELDNLGLLVTYDHGRDS